MQNGQNTMIIEKNMEMGYYHMETKLECNMIAMKKCIVSLKVIKAKVSCQNKLDSEIESNIDSEDEEERSLEERFYEKRKRS